MNKAIKLFFIFIVIIVSTWKLPHYLPLLTLWIQELGAYAFIGFLILYCFAILLFVPIEPIALASGSLFGFYYGFLTSLFCAVVSANIAFMISRYFGSHYLPYNKNKLIFQYLERFESFGWRSLALSRLLPFLPCTIVNYGYGLTNMRLFVYTLTNFIFFIPYKLVITYAGAQL